MLTYGLIVSNKVSHVEMCLVLRGIVPYVDIWFILGTMVSYVSLWFDVQYYFKCRHMAQITEYVFLELLKILHKLKRKFSVLPF